LFTVISTYRDSIEEVLPYEKAHVAWVTEAYASGRILVSGPRMPMNGGVIVLDGASVADVEQFMAGDPFVAADVVTFEVYEFLATEFPNRSVGFDSFFSAAKV
jgi:uncharacterized protein YciI